MSSHIIDLVQPVRTLVEICDSLNLKVQLKNRGSFIEASLVSENGDSVTYDHCVLDDVVASRMRAESHTRENAIASLAAALSGATITIGHYEKRSWSWLLGRRFVGKSYVFGQVTA